MLSLLLLFFIFLSQPTQGEEFFSLANIADSEPLISSLKFFNTFEYRETVDIALFAKHMKEAEEKMLDKGVCACVYTSW